MKTYALILTAQQAELLHRALCRIIDNTDIGEGDKYKKLRREIEGQLEARD